MTTILTADILAAGSGATPARVAAWLPYLARACALFEINTPERLAAFLAQVGHESGSLAYVSEKWGPTATQKTYEGRITLGNTQPGDGERFKGHGLIQTTGRFNHAATRDGLRLLMPDVPDFEADPEALMQPQWAALSAGWYWKGRALNALADIGDFERITKKINGGLNGQADREQRFNAAKAAIARAVAAPAPVAAAAPVSPPPLVMPPAPPIAPIATPAPTVSTTLQETTMDPFSLAALAKIITAVPDLVRTFGSGSEVSERNAKAADLVVSVAKEAIGATNEQDLVQRLDADPAAAAAVREAVQKNYFEIQAAAEKSVAAAREFVTSYGAMKDVRTVLGGFTFPELLSLIFVIISAAGAGIVLLGDGYSAEIKGAVITLMLIAGYTGVREFWFGSSPAEQARNPDKSLPG